MSGLREIVRSWYPFLLLVPVVIPLVISTGLFFPYLAPKTFLFDAVMLVSLGMFAVLAFSGAEFYGDRLRRKVTWIPGMLLVLAYLASIFGLDFFRSFWSTYTRGDGLLMLTLSVASFYLILLSADRRFFTRLLRGVTVVGGIVAVWGIGEWLFGSGGRVESSLGNAAFLAGYLGLAVFATLAAAPSYYGGARKVVYAVAGLEVLTILLTATRGTILALLVTAFLACAYYAWRFTGQKRVWALGVLVVMLALGGTFIALRSSFVHSSFQPLARVAQVSRNDPDIASRLFIWRNITGEILQRPILGYGAEHNDFLYDRFYDPSVIKEEWFDRAHNAFLDYAAQYGLLGPILYIVLICLFAILGYRYGTRNPEVGPILVFAAVTYAIQNFFIFDTISSWWLFLALLAGLFALDSDVKASPLPLPRIPSLGVGVAVIAFLLIIPASILPLVANVDLARAYFRGISDVTQSAATGKAGYLHATSGDLEYGYEFYSLYTGTQAVYLTGQARVLAYETARDILVQNFRKYPFDAHTALCLAHVLDMAPPEVARDVALEKEAIQRVMDLSPKRSQPWYILANLSITAAHATTGAERAAFYDVARSILEKYLTYVPNLSEPHFVLAELALSAGDVKGALKEASIGVLDYKPDKDTARRASKFFEAVQDWPHAIQFLQEATRLDPTDYSGLYDLARIKYTVGDVAGAEAIVAKLRIQNPAILNTDPEFLGAITAYETQRR